MPPSCYRDPIGWAKESTLHAASSARGFIKELTWGDIVRLLVLGLVIVGCLVGFAVCTYFGLVLKLLKFVHGLGYWGNLIMVGAIVCASFPFFVGYSLMGMGCGFLYGFAIGEATMFVGSVCGGMIVFVLSRLLLSRWLSSMFKRRPKLWALFVAVGENGGKLSFILRLTPIPYGIQNALLGASCVPWWRYVLGTVFGVIPDQCLSVYIGTQFATLAELVSGKMKLTWEDGLIIGSQVVVIVLLFILLTYIGRRALRSVTASNPDPGEAEDAETSVVLLDADVQEAEPRQDTYQRENESTDIPLRRLSVHAASPGMVEPATPLVMEEPA